MDPTMRKNETAQRYELLLDGDVASFAEYFEDGDRVVMPHTVTNPAFRGRGLAAQLVQFALDDVRAADRKVVPNCWFVADFVQQHAEYQDLLADDG